MHPKTIQIQGQVIDAKTRRGLPSLRVEAWDRDAAGSVEGDDRLGAAVSNEDGRFTIDVQRAAFDDGGSDVLPDLYFKIFAGKRLIYNAWMEPMRNWTAGAQPLVIEVDPQPAGGEEQTFLVHGQVLQVNGPPVPGVQARVVHKNLRSEIPLGEPGLTDDLGRYSIRYSPPQGVKEINLVVRAVQITAHDGQTTETILAESGLICNPKPEEQVDLVAGGGQYRGFSEYERLSQALEAHLDGVVMADLSVADIEFLECTTRQDPVKIAYLAIASRYARRTGAPAAAFYGLLRRNLPARLQALLSQPERVQQRALESALQANLIPVQLEERIRPVLDKLKEAAVSLSLEVAEGEESTSLAALLETTGLSGAQQGSLLAKYARHPGSIQEFWAALKKDPDFSQPGRVEGVQFSLQLGTLTGGYVPLVGRLQGLRQQGKIETVKDLVTYQPGDWLELTRETGTPPGVPGETEEQRAGSYARSLARTLEAAFPTEAVVAGLQRAATPDQQDLLRFFANSPDFQLSSNIDRYIKENASTAFDGIPDTGKVTLQLKELHRLYKIAPTAGKFAAISALQAAGFRSAQAIVHRGREPFVRAMAPALGGEAAAEAVFARADYNHTLAMNSYARFGTAFVSNLPAAIHAPTAAGVGDPTWEALFGSLSFCECEDCRSVYSPAAYFVDLLQFVRQQTAIQILPGGIVTYPTVTQDDGMERPKTALDVLFERRPDLGEIELSCQNTNTLLPYIDLANEALESVVDTLSQSSGGGIPVPAGHQTTWTAEELAANAEYLDEQAYEHLAGLVYPRRLPFHLWLEEARTYLGHLGASLVEVMADIQRPGLTGADLRKLDRQIAFESLRLSPTAARIISRTLRPARHPAEYWGIERAKWPDALSDLPTFLEQAGLSLEDYDDLADAQFVNGGAALSVHYATACNLEEATILNLTTEVLDRMQRFLRLQQTLGWETTELDETILALGAADLTLDFLEQVAQIQSLKTRFALPHLELLSWWANLSTRVDKGDLEDRSFYEQLFLNQAVLSPVDSAFELDSLSAGMEPLEEHTTAILAALSITQEDLGLILEATGIQESDGLTLARLSTLFRHASLAKALDLSIRDCLSVQSLTGIDPFASPQAALDFGDEAEAIATSPFTILTLDYLLRQVYQASSGAAPSESSILLVLDGIKAGLQTIENTPENAARRNQFVVQYLASSLGLEVVSADALLTQYVPAAGNPTLKSIDIFLAITPEMEAYSAQALDTYRLLNKIATVLKTLRVTSGELAWVFETGPQAGWIDLSKLPLAAPVDPAEVASSYTGWRRLAALYSLRDQYPAAGDINVFSVLDTARGAGDRAATLGALSALTGWDTGDIDLLTGPAGFGLTYPDHYQDERYLLDLQAAMAFLQRLGLSAEAVIAWQVDEDLATMQATARAIKSAVKAKYDNATWLTIARPLKDQLRQQQRDALVAGIAALDQELNEASEIYERYLIDPEMNACMDTSRIKQAISSVQLFVQRALLNLEPDVEIGAAAAEQWTWMKSYRVWEANRKIFLYPENYLLPELRDDKSPFFQDLENELNQNEMTQQVAETALRSYLEKLNEVANLDVRALYHQVEAGEFPVDILHVFARTYSSPHRYYYRQLIDRTTWTPWEPLEVDIRGDHLLAVVWNRRLYLIWFEILEPEDETLSGWEVRPDWSVSQDGRWSPASQGEEPLQVSSTSPRELFLFKPEIQEDGDLLITCYTFLEYISESDQTDQGLPDGPYVHLDGNAFKQGTFRFSSCTGQVITASADSTVELIYLPGRSQPENMHFVELTDVEGDFDEESNSLDLPSALVGEDGNLGDEDLDRTIQILDRTPGPFVLAAPLQYDQFVSQDTFFFQDNKRAYFVIPGTAYPMQTISNVLQDADAVSFDLVQQTAALDFVHVTSKLVARITEAKDQAIPSAAPAGHTPSNLTAASSEPAAANPYVLVGDLLDTAAIDTSGSTIQISESATPLIEKVFRFHTAYHPYVCAFLEALNREGIHGLMQRSLQASYAATFSERYEPLPASVATPLPQEDVDFSPTGAYALYNWETFFHTPLLIATRLSQNQRYEEAQDWFHYIFNPMARRDGSAVSGAERYWVFYPFYLENIPETIDDLMLELNEGDPELAAQVELWRANPFNPHLIARLRPAAYMKTVVMKYLDNLIAWGDSLFAQDTIENLNEATQLYVLAASILGPRPQSLPASLTTDIETYNSLAGKLDELSNALVQLENQVPDPEAAGTRLNPLVGWGLRSWDDLLTGTGFDPWIGNLPGSVNLPSLDTLYFGIPNNEQLGIYWDTIEDRLFKIRNCMNIEGLVRELPLFEPPLNPLLILQARAQGVDLASALNDLVAPLPHYRFQIVLQKAVEFCGDVRALGVALLAALEKQDAEALALLRAGHETQLLEAIRQLKERQVAEAEESLEEFNRSRDIAALRQSHYQELLALSKNEQEISQLDSLDQATNHQSISQGSFTAANILLDIAAGIKGGFLKPGEVFAILGYSSQALGYGFSVASGLNTTAAGKAGLNAGYQRRNEEWTFQIDLASHELEQIDRHIAAAAIRVEIARIDRDNTARQIEQAQEVYDFMKTKYTNQELYNWMVSQISSIYFLSYQMAYDLGKRAEQAYRRELGLADSSFIQYGYWDSLKKGLLSGEKLNYDLRRMEMSYLDLNQREYEITRHVSLRQVNPLALLSLKATASCEVTLPEWLFDLDNPGHYLRRIKHVSLTIPAVTGPYTSVSCTLSHQKSSLRISPLLKNGQYARQGMEDERFVDDFSAIQPIVTSSGNNDSGLFETNLRDERYLPFEGAGVESTWTLEMPAAFRPFDYNTITDVILHVSYTARPGGTELRDKALQSVTNLFDQAAESGLTLLFSLKNDFSNEWYRFLNGTGSFAATIKREYFPYFTQGRPVSIQAIRLCAIQEGQLNMVTPEGLNLGGLTQSLETEGAFTLTLNTDSAVLVRDQQALVFMLIDYTLGTV